MLTVSPTNGISASTLVPVLPAKPKPIDDYRLAVEIELLRRRQLRRGDVRELLIRRAERKGVAR